jgi:hypothetical protein
MRKSNWTPFSGDVAHALRRRCDLQLRDLPFYPLDFVDRHDAVNRSQLTLPLRSHDNQM